MIRLPSFGPQTFLRRTRGAAYAGPFDGISFAALYGLKRFLTSYTGSLIRLRRDSDNAESDFGYVEATGLLDTAAIVTWLGGANGFIVKWYDQSGNSRDAAQATAANQPAYVASAVNSKPGILPDNSPDSLGFTAIGLTNSTTIFCGKLPNPGDAEEYFVGRNDTSPTSLWGYDNDAEGVRAYSSSGGYFGGLKRTDLYGAVHAFSLECTGTAAALRIDGTTQTGSVTLGANWDPNVLFRYENGRPFNGYCPFVAICASVISAANYNAIGSELASLYGLTWNTVS